jgi:hypothetical protein
MSMSEITPRREFHDWTDADLLTICDVVVGELTMQQAADWLGLGRGAVASMTKRVKREYFVIA